MTEPPGAMAPYLPEPAKQSHASQSDVLQQAGPTAGRA